MEFRIAASFTDALSRLPAQDQKAAKVSALDLQLDPSSPGLQFHRIDNSKDPNFWSIRVNRDVRIIVHKTAAGLLLAYVDHHDKAYAWAERRRIEAHPKTGAIQIVEVRERVEEAAPDLFRAPEPAGEAAPEPSVFAALSPDDLLSIGAPADWIEAILAATESGFFDLAAHLPAEAAETLLDYAATGVLKRPEPVAPEDPYQHPDSLRRFRFIENEDELRAALDAPWDKWSVFLHPSQRGVIERIYSGPARVAGSAGTGKTVVALHRAARLARQDGAARILLTTFSQPLADELQRKIAILTAAAPGAGGRITVAPWEKLADELHQLLHGRRPRVASETHLRSVVSEAMAKTPGVGVSEKFLSAEFSCVVDAWGVGSLEAYAETPRLGRRTRLGAKQRARIWPAMEAIRSAVTERGLTTWPQVFAALAEHYAGQEAKPFTHIVVDEAQDLGVPELRLLRALAPTSDDSLFFAGDLGQRIFQPPFSWKSLGVDVRGRSSTLKVNYRTSHQIREAADRLLPPLIRDVDGREEERKGTVSVFEGPSPEVDILETANAEIGRVAEFIAQELARGVRANEVGIFVRSRAELDRARAAATAAGLSPVEPGDTTPAAGDAVLVGVMHLAKGLEFRAVVVMACDAEVLPLQERIDLATDETELDEVYETERNLLYVACTRARDSLLVTGAAPGSEFLRDLTAEA